MALTQGTLTLKKQELDDALDKIGRIYNKASKPTGAGEITLEENRVSYGPLSDQISTLRKRCDWLLIDHAENRLLSRKRLIAFYEATLEPLHTCSLITE